MNKLDRDGREPLDLIGELEDTLGIEAYPMNWPIGMGKGLKGLYDIYNNRIELYQREDQGENFLELDENGEIKGDHPLKEESIYQQVLEEVELVKNAGNEFDESKDCNRGFNARLLWISLNEFWGLRRSWMPI